jgi:hypothetical protein
VLNARIFNEREEVNGLRQSLAPEVELLCMLSPLQVIYALKAKANRPQTFTSLINSIRVGQS